MDALSIGAGATRSTVQLFGVFSRFDLCLLRQCVKTRVRQQENAAEFNKERTMRERESIRTSCHVNREEIGSVAIRRCEDITADNLAAMDEQVQRAS